MYDRRCRDRRERSVSLRWPERRTGFDRRSPCPVFYTPGSDERRFAATLAVIFVLGVLDWALTSYALHALGAFEANPFMRAAFDAGPGHAFLLKLASLTAVTVGMWWLRRHRSVILLATMTAAFHIALIGYHVTGMAILS